MKMLIRLIFFPFFCLSTAGICQVNCDLTYLTTIENFTVYTHNPSGAILYRAKMSIDADGCPRAYGPNNSGLDWTANAGYPGNWWGIVTDSNGDPIIQGAGDPYPGMYVSSTSLVRSGYANTNPLRYVDSENIPYIALPSALQSLANIAKGDLAFIRNTTNGNTSYAYFADSGPAGKLGEGSMFLAAELGINSSPKTGGTSQPVIDYIVFPQSGLGQGTHLSLAQINSMGQTELYAAGGAGLADCIDSMIPVFNCSNTTPLSCGVAYNGAVSTTSSLVGTYGCNSWTETGPERVHSIIPAANGTITATVSNFTGDLDVYILGSCDPSDCLGTVSASSATFNNAMAGQTYYIVVDADDGSGSAYNLVVACPASTSSEDITISSAIISSSQVNPGDTISVSANQNYSGSQPDSLLPSFDLNYYLSTDCNLSPEDILMGSDDSEIGNDVPSSNENALLNIPANISEGSYYILFAADNNGELSESNESNNIVCIAITIDALELNCINAIPLTCGIMYSATSSAAQSAVGSYGCNSWTETGPERVHSIIPASNGSITAVVSNYTGDLDVYILGSCDPSDCLGTVSSSSASYNNALAGQIYYVVVDADDGSGSAYDIVVTCPAVLDDITLSDASLSSNQLNIADTFSVSVNQNYYGTQPDSVLPSINIDYYLSADCIFSSDDTLLGSDDSEIGSDVPVSNETATLTIPANTAAGTYYILFAGDNDGEIQEGNETNNSACVAVTITQPCSIPATGTDIRVACNSFTWINGIVYESSTDTAKYTFAGGATTGCDSIVTLNLTIINIDTSLTVSNDSIIALSNYSSYQWINCTGGSVLTGDTGNVFVATASGNYGVIISENQCADTSSCYEIVIIGLMENNPGTTIQIYPNPAGDFITVDLGRTYNDATVNLFRADGKILKTLKVHKKRQVKVVLKGFETGPYLLSVEEENMRWVVNVFHDNN